MHINYNLFSLELALSKGTQRTLLSSVLSSSIFYICLNKEIDIKGIMNAQCCITNKF